jgi:hypothetical protein
MHNLEIDNKQTLRSAASCLLEYIKIHGENNTSFEILTHLANETIQRIEQNQDSWQFTNEAIYKAIVGNKEIEYSSWFSRHWKKLNEVSLTGLESFAHKNGYKYFAWIEKIAGGGSRNQSLYFLVANPVKNIDLLNADVKPDVQYIEITNVSPSWWAKWLFNQDNSATGWRKMIYVLYPVAEIIIAFISFIFLWLAISLNKNPLNTQDLAFFSCILILFFYVRYTLTQWSRLVDDRIIMAPENLMSWSEGHLNLELATTPDKKNKALRLVKYASQCPICEAEILLDKGEPDFPRRIVGRCKESPREHIYSFDRITLSGNKLR